MRGKLNILIAALLMFFVATACSMLRPKRDLKWHLTLLIDSNVAESERDDVARHVVTVIETRLDALGISNFKVDRRGSLILVDLPNVADPERVKRVISAWGKLDLAHVISPPSPSPAQTYSTKEEAIESLNTGGTIPVNRRVLPYAERDDSTNPGPSTWVVVEDPPVVTGSDVRTASAVNLRGGDDTYQIQFSLKSDGARRFGAWTGTNTNEYLAVILNDEVKSMPYIRSQIFDQGEISGRFTKQSAEDLALVLKAGALPARVHLVKETTDK